MFHRLPGAGRLKSVRGTPQFDWLRRRRECPHPRRQSPPRSRLAPIRHPAVRQAGVEGHSPCGPATVFIVLHHFRRIGAPRTRLALPARLLCDGQNHVFQSLAALRAHPPAALGLVPFITFLHSRYAPDELRHPKPGHRLLFALDISRNLKKGKLLLEIGFVSYSLFFDVRQPRYGPATRSPPSSVFGAS